MIDKSDVNVFFAITAHARDLFGIRLRTQVLYSVSNGGYNCHMENMQILA